jgi:hypothetical protein
MKVRQIKLKISSKRIHFRGIHFPLCRAMCVQQMVRELLDTQSSPDGLYQVLRRSVLARRNTRFHRLTEYNKVGQVIQAVGSRRCRLAHRVPERLVLRQNSSKKGI